MALRETPAWQCTNTRSPLFLASSMNSKASSKYCLRFWCPLSVAGICLYVIPQVSWWPVSCGVTLRTQVVPRSCRQDKSAAFLLLPRYKKGKTREAGCESMSARAGQDADEGKPLDVSPETKVSSHRSLCLRWNSVWPLGCWGIGLKRNTRQLLGLLILIVGTLCTRVQSQISVKPIIQATKCLSDTMQVIPKRARSPSDVKFGGEYASFTAVHLMFMFCVILDPRTKSKSPCTSRKYHSFFCLPY